MKTIEYIHMMKISSDRYKDTILFRNYLQKNIKILKKYEISKREVANYSAKWANDVLKCEV